MRICCRGKAVLRRSLCLLLCAALLSVPAMALEEVVDADLSETIGSGGEPAPVSPTPSADPPDAPPGETQPDPTPEETTEPSPEPSPGPIQEPPPEPTPEIDFGGALRDAGFPESYIAPLLRLHESYPVWEFLPFFPPTDWHSALAEESVLGRSLVWSGAPSSWKSTREGAYNWTDSTWYELDSGGWVAASEGIIAYYMDPRNFLDADRIFQFLDQRFDAATQTAEGLNTIAAGTYLADGSRNVDPGGASGVTTCADALYIAGETWGVSPYVLASMMLLEQGASGASESISGLNARFPGVYNAFNVGAYKAPGFTAVERGLWYASGGSGGVGVSYGRPWNTLYKAILGGAEYYARNFVNQGQTTLYLKRFNVQGTRMFRNQYMTSVAGAASEGSLLAGAYSESMRALPLRFSIPVYAGMPALACPQPTGTGSPNALLRTLGVDGGAMTPEFDRHIMEYTVIVPETADSAEIIAEPLSAAASVSGTGGVTLQPGENAVIITVTAENGAAAVYTLRILRRTGESGLPVTEEPTPVPGLSEPVAETPSAPEPSASPAPEPTAPPSRHRGDVNGDGQISIGDLIRIRNHLLGAALLSDEELAAADVNGDGAVQINDLVRLRNWLLGDGTPGEE